MTSLWHYDSPLGPITMAGREDGLSGLWFDGQKYFGAGLSDGALEGRLPIFDETCRWLDTYFSGEKPDFTPTLALAGTEFRREVWGILLEIPYGHTITYGEIARELARRRGLAHMSSQAVGGAVGHNPASIIVPCHRVVGSDGSLTGYAGGIERKRWLLGLEGVDVSRLWVPRRGTAL